DPGDAAPELLDALEGYTVKTVVNTHCHCDHCGGNAGVLAKTGAELVCHEDELGLLRALPQQGQMFGVPFEASPDPDRYIKEGDTIAVGSVSFEVRDAPGHSPGHVVLVGDGFVIGGDVLFQGSIGRTDLPGGSYPQLIHSIKTKLLTLPDDTIVYSGHGPETTIGAERRTNPFLVGA
ncbi:MAG: MBL fold metallo-hydrolase, partial [Candidatus Hydrogenedentes bacterium]|nr:MBL fold metallo-hydrolase [Candidatus Hydrogenedentota bacterium]